MPSRHSISRHLRRLAPAILIAAAAAAAACGPFRRAAGPQPALLFFTNESPYQADVYVVVPRVSARRIGTVMARRTDTLVVPVDLATRGEALNVIARLTARAEPPQTGPVSILPGEHYRVTLSFDAKLLTFLRVGP